MCLQLRVAPCVWVLAGGLVCMCYILIHLFPTSVMFCSLPDSLAGFAINTPSSRFEALPDGAGTICLADAS